MRQSVLRIMMLVFWLPFGILSAFSQNQYTDGGAILVRQVGSDCKSNDCQSCAVCDTYTIPLPGNARVIKVHCWTTANYPSDYAPNDLHEVDCGTDVAWSIWDQPTQEYQQATGKLAVYSTYHNRSSDRDRYVKLSVEWQ